jgi:hypothetical protein
VAKKIGEGTLILDKDLSLPFAYVVKYNLVRVSNKVFTWYASVRVWRTKNIIVL